MEQTPSSGNASEGGFLSFFIPRKDFFFTPLLIDINILIFILMVASGVHVLTPDSLSLLNWGANFRPMTQEGDWWRLFTCCFIHIGILHLLMNMYGLLYIGVLLEPLLGRARFLSAYLLAGIISSLTSLWWHDLTVSAGASGAIFGMYGVFLAMLTTNLIEKEERDALLSSTVVFVGYNLLNGLRGGIDNAAHIGGLLSGVAIGYAMLPSIRNEDVKNLKSGTIGALTLATVVATVAILSVLPNDIGQYDTKMQVFIDLESKALEVYKLPENAPKAEMLAGLKANGIDNWQKNIALLNEADQLNLPDELHQRNSKLIQYCELRIKSYELICKAVEEDSGKYQGQIDDYNKQINGLLKDLGGE